MKYGNLFFSSSTGGFYDDAYHKADQIPSDAKAITRDKHKELMNGQAIGKVISSENGLPLLKDKVVTAEFNKNKALFLIQDTDWVNQPDVYDTSLTPHLLNRDEFIQYRVALRAISVSPTSGNITYPVKPTAKWST